MATSAKGMAKKIQRNFSFKKRVPQHVRRIDDLLKNFNTLLDDPEKNQRQVKVLLGSLEAELISLKTKISDKDLKQQIQREIKSIRRNKNGKIVINETKAHNGFHFPWRKKLTHDWLWNNYANINTIHSNLTLLYKDKKITLYND